MRRSAIDTAKEAYELVIETGKYYDSLSEVAKKYNILVSSLIKNVRAYRKRVVAPKPTEEEEKKFTAIKESDKKTITFSNENNYVFLSNIVDAVKEAKGETDLVALFNKYELTVLKKTILEYLAYGKGISLEVKTKLTDALDFFDELAKKKKEKPNLVEESKARIRDFILKYLESDDVFPDSVFLQFYSLNYQIIHFTPTLESFAKDSEENRALYERYLHTKEERLNSFIESLKRLLGSIPLNKISVLDLELATKMSAKKLNIILSKGEIVSVLGRMNVNSLVSVIRKYKGYMRLLTKEEALRMKYSYNGRTMALEDIDKIFDYLDENNLEPTYINIILLFNKMVKGEIVLSSKMNKVFTINPL